MEPMVLNYVNKIEGMEGGKESKSNLKASFRKGNGLGNKTF